MKRFAALFTQLDQTTKTLVKVESLASYFSEVDDQDKLWTIAILSHRRPKRPVNSTMIKQWAAELSGVPFWLFEESYHVVGDLAETIALILPEPSSQSEEGLSYWIWFIKSMTQDGEEEKKAKMKQAWSCLSAVERFVFNKLLTGGFRMGVSQKLMTRALAKSTGLDENVLAHRLMGNWTPDTTTFADLILSEDPKEDDSRPYPFYLAYALEDAPGSLGNHSDWLAERKWDGIRGQIIIRNDELYVWSRGEELVTDKYPEYHEFKSILPHGTVIDGEILPFKEGKPLPFAQLQTRIGRKNLTKGILEKSPVIFKAYDLLEWEAKDTREWPLKKRRERLASIVKEFSSESLKISDEVVFSSWHELGIEQERSREYYSEGIMLKRLDSTYRSGRKKGDWWKWKVEPLTIDAVMIYAMRGHGRRANLYTDYTFAVWDGDQLVPFTKAYSGLTDAEIHEVDRYVKKNTIERFGPVRSVTPELVFEIAFEGINKSTRHKSGVALRFPRIKRWRKDKPKEEANTIADLLSLLDIYG
ncbi:ATP-dependent DNA ligase [Fulvivirga sp. M361]|uniref:ATP-dependent DNA ligase n=1 Tax=Fulvivirga sp. M361 TaxID=2594266 RepID=UPI001179C9E4|nr:ATP-dependent DNA ligase [Fulvivirga sp. M361]TRX62173.1 ATP-dependent DNA ligase [Fulvivirga sp. M361]